MTTLFLPEFILVGTCLALFFASLKPCSGGTSRGMFLCGMIAAAASLIVGLEARGSLFAGVLQVDFFSQLVKMLLAAGTVILLFFAREPKGINPQIRPEYYLFLALSVFGLFVLVSAVELLVLFVALELSSFAIYILVPMRDDRGGLRMQMEAGIKYILFGVVATGIMLFGMSYLVGLTGVTRLDILVPRLQQFGMSPLVVAGVTMVMAGFFFKLAIFPFHFWMPDVYQGASNETAAFIASVPKVAAVAVLIRILALAVPGGWELKSILTLAAVCSMFYGNLAALVQKDIKRLLGFSGIAHAGYILLGLVTFRQAGAGAALYYIAGYLLMNLACFLVICKVSKEGENLDIRDLVSLHRRSPILALTLLVGMFALAGIPPFVGFMGKFFLLTVAFRGGNTFLVIVAAINTALALYYYLSVVRVSYCTDEAVDMRRIATDMSTKIVCTVLILSITLLGVMPQEALSIANRAVSWLPQ